MNSLRSVGVLLVVCAGLSGLVAYECYRRADQAGKALAAQIDVFEFESVSIPIYTRVGAFVSVMLLVAGIRCLVNAHAANQTHDDSVVKK